MPVFRYSNLPTKSGKLLAVYVLISDVDLMNQFKSYTVMSESRCCCDKGGFLALLFLAFDVVIFKTVLRPEC